MLPNNHLASDRNAPLSFEYIAIHLQQLLKGLCVSDFMANSTSRPQKPNKTKGLVLVLTKITLDSVFFHTINVNFQLNQKCTLN